jgi:AraC family transcriptional regulator
MGPPLVPVRRYFGGALRRQMEHAGIVLSEVQYGAARKCSQHTHGHAFFSLLLRGHYAERYRRGALEYRPFDVGFHPEATEHADETGRDNSRFFLIELEESWIGRLREYSPSADLAPRMCNGHASWLAARLYAQLANQAVSHLTVEGIVLELLATLAKVRSSGRKAPLWIPTVLDVLEAEHASRHTLSGIANRLGLHPVYVARTFRKFVGESPARYLMRVRIRAAMENLANSEVSVSEIALLTGFSDQSHLTRAMKQYTGMTPAAFRLTCCTPRTSLRVWAAQIS